MKFRRQLILAFVPALALSAGLAACGGGDDDDAAPTSQAPISSATPGDAVPEGAPFVDQDDLKFKPDELTVPAGEAIYFKNSETALHTVTINGENVSGNMRKDEVVLWTPPEPGVYKITCDYHPQMKATITVE